MKILIIVLSLLCCMQAYAQDFTMTLKGVPYGGVVTDIEQNAAGDIFAIASGQLFKSANGGTSWTRPTTLSGVVNLIDIDIDLNGIVYLATSGNTVFISTDATATTFTSRGGPSGSSPRMIKKYGTSATSPLYIVGRYNFSTGKQSVYRSIDNSVSWTEVYAESSTNNEILNIDVNAVGNVFLYAFGKGVIKSPTGLSGYAASNNGITTPESTSYSPANLAYAGGDLYAVFSDKIYKSADNGINWTDATPPGYTYFYGACIGTAGTSVYILDINMSNLHVYSGSWSTMAIGTTAPAVNAIFAKSTNELYLGTDLGVLKSATGTTWTRANNGMDAQKYVTSSGNNLFTFGDNLYTMGRPVFKSTDAGTTWAYQGLPITSGNAISVTTDGMFLSPHGTTTMVSADAGATWTSKATPLFVDVFAVDGNDIYGIGASTGIIKSTNSGDSWSTLAVTGLPASWDIFWPTNTFVSNGYLYINLFVGGNRYFRIDLTTLVASEIPSPPVAAGVLQPDGLWEYNGKLVMLTTNNASTNQLFTSTDFGANWTNVPMPATTAPSFHVTANGYWVVLSSTGTVLLSRDEGQSWLTSSLGVTNVTSAGTIIDGQGYLCILVDSKGFYQSSKPVYIPASPTDLRIIGSTYNKVRLEWNDNSVNETYFRVERSLGDNTHYDSVGFVSVANQAVKAATLSTLVDPERTFYYRVIAVNAAGTSASYSNELSFATPAKCPTTLPDNRSWLITTQNVSGMGVRTGTTGLIGSRLSDFQFGGSVLGGTSPAWTAPYNLINSNFFGTVSENCGSIFLDIVSTSVAAPDGNGTWDPVTNKVTIKWKINEAVVAPGTAAPFSEVSELVMSNTYPVPNPGTIVPNVGAYDDTGMGLSWINPISYATETAIERATSTGGPYVEVGRVTPPNLVFVDRSGLVAGTTYYYRLKGYNPDSPAGIAGSVTTGTVFAKPYFAGVETQNGHPISTRVAAAWADVNNDGFDDLLFSPGTDGNETPSFLINQQNGTFIKKTFLDNLSFIFYYPRIVDFNNDGNVDVIGYNIHPSSNRLEIYAGDGTGNFSLAWSGPKNSQLFTLIEDFDDDGKLDFLTGTRGTTATMSFMTNTGDFNFVKTGDLIVDEAFTFSHISSVDYDNDNDRDIYFGGAFDNNTVNFRMYVNNGDGTYTNTPIPSLNSGETSSINSAEWVDIDNDLDFDLMVYHGTGAIRKLFQNNGAGNFVNLATSTTTDLVNAFSLTWLDVDNDGDQDMVSNVISGPQSSIHLNNGAGVFTRKQGESVTVWNLGRNMYVAADYNHDGSQDLFVGSNDVKGHMFKGNNYVPGNKWITVNLRGVKSNRTAIGATVKVTAGALVQRKMVAINLGSNWGGHNSLMPHFGVGAATAVDIEVTWPSGKKQTVNNVPVNQFYLVIEDTDGPAITSRTPAHNTIDVAVDTQVSFEMSEAFTIEATRFVNVYTAGDLANPLFHIAANAGTVNGNTITYTLPDALPFGEEIHVSIDQGAFVDVFGNGNNVVSTADWIFSTALQIDTTNPSVTFDPAPYQVLDKGFAAMNASITATDNLEVASVTVHTRKITDADFTQMDATKDSGNKWTVSFTGAMQDDMGFEYYIEAKDPALNVGRSPATGYHKSKTKLTAANQPTITVNSGGTKQSWRIISIPYDLPNDDRQVSNIFASLGASSRQTWRFLHYSNTPIEQWLAYPDFTTVDRGKGYFINSIDGGTVTLTNPTSPGYTRNNLFSLDLVKGWNQVGNPYSVSINWQNIQVYNNNPDIGPLVLFNNGSYSGGSVIQPGQGGFVFMNNPAKVSFSFPGQTSGSRTNDTPNGNLDSKNWLVDLKLQSGDITSDLAGFGMNENASMSYDERDRINAPRFFEFLEANFPHPEHFMKKFARDIITPSPEAQWEFTVDTSIDDVVSIAWNNSAYAADRIDLYLYDIERQIPVDMRSENSYSFDPTRGRRFRVYYGENALSKIVPEKALLGGAFPNPTTGLTTIQFSLPERNGSFGVRLEIFDMLGRKVETILAGDMRPGFYKADWQPGETANSNGLYIYRLTVDGEAGTSPTGKIMLKR